MKQTKNKCLIWCIGMLFMLMMNLPMTVSAANVYSEGDFHYQLEDEAITITEYFGKDTEVTVPSIIAGYPVSKIAEGAFVGTSVTTLNLPDTIMTIENQAIDTDIRVVYASQQQKEPAKDTDTTDENKKDEPVRTDAGESTTEKIKEESSTSESTESNGTVDEADMDLSGVSETQSDKKQQVGILASNDTVISVDDKNRLVSIDKDNKVTVLDDSMEYKVEEQEDSSVKITDSENREVTVDENGTVTVPAMQDKDQGSNLMLFGGLAVGIIVVAIIILVIRKKRKM